MQGVENHVRLGFGADQEIEARKCTIEKRVSDAIENRRRRARWRRRSVEGRALIRRHAKIFALNIKLNAVAEVIVERDLGDGCVDPDLRLRLVKLPDRLLDKAIIFCACVYQQRIGGNIGGDSDALPSGLPPPRGGAACLPRTSRPPRPPFRPPPPNAPPPPPPH